VLIEEGLVKVDVGNSVRKCINDWEYGELDAAMMHACFAVDGTRRKLYQDNRDNNTRFTKLLRDNYSILGPMGAPGVDLRSTRFPVRVLNPKAAGGQPDIADVIYGIHRCCHGHGEALPEGFELMPDAAGAPRVTRLTVCDGKVRLSDRIIFGLLAVAVMSPVNSLGESVPDGYHLTFGDETRMNINDWWGGADRFEAIAVQDPTPLVTLDFGAWMNRTRS